MKKWDTAQPHQFPHASFVICPSAALYASQASRGGMPGQHSIIMEHQQNINRVELQGNVGSVRLTTVGERKVIRFSVVTNRIYRNNDGDMVIETTWHSCTAWDGKDICPLEDIVKGTPVHLTGRLQMSRYTDQDGVDRAVTEIVANTLEVVKS